MPTDEIFDDEYMNELMMNPNLHEIEESDEEKKEILSRDDIEDQDDFEVWQRFCQ